MQNLTNKVNDQEATLITYDEISKHPIGEKVEIIKGVFTERLPTEYDVLFFRVEQKKGTIIPDNFHDCIEEMVVGKGKLLEKISGTILNKYERMIFKIGQSHITVALEDCIWYAHLYKQK